MNTPPKVSIIIPVYNVEQYLHKCLDSLINQSLKDIEMICINDGSTDNSLKILKEYAAKDCRIKIIDSENKGLSAVRNRGLKEAEGEYIGYVDSDDWVDLNFYEKLYNATQKYNCDIACCSIIRSSKKHQKYKLEYIKEKYFESIEDKIKATKIPKYNYVWNKIYKRKHLVNMNLPFPDGKSYEDIGWSIQIVYYANGVVTVPNCNYYYRKNFSSIVMNKSGKNLADCKYTEALMLKFAKEKNIEYLINGYKMTHRKRIKFFNLNINFLKIFYYFPNIKVYTLFGVIPIFALKCDFQKDLA